MWQSSYINTLNKNIMIVQVKKKHGKKSNIKITWSSPIQHCTARNRCALVICFPSVLHLYLTVQQNWCFQLSLQGMCTRHCFVSHALHTRWVACLANVLKVYWSQSVAFYRCTWSYDAWLVHLYCTDDRLMSVWMKIMTQAEKMAAVVHSLWHYALKSQVWLPALAATFCLWWKATMLMHHALSTCCTCSKANCNAISLAKLVINE